jgi:hypothetical protein
MDTAHGLIEFSSLSPDKIREDLVRTRRKVHSHKVFSIVTQSFRVNDGLDDKYENVRAVAEEKLSVALPSGRTDLAKFPTTATSNLAWH